MPRRHLLAVLAASSALAAVAGGSIGAQASPQPGPSKTMATPTTAVPALPAAPAPAVPVTTAPAAPSTTVTTVGGGPDIASVIDVGDAKPARFYDAYLAAALVDIDAWWAVQFPQLFGEPWESLRGGVFAGYPERTDPIPGCGFDGDTTYQDVSDAGAFYCPEGDFMAYDDGDDGVIFQLAEEFGPSVVAVVMAHEYGHAVQRRVGTLDDDVATVITEQQADCISGAWARRAWNSEAPSLVFTDDDIRSGLIALVVVRDPIGYNVFEPGGHGSAFDRIGAFQEGFFNGPAACTGLIEKPLPLMENEFNPDIPTEAANNGNAPFGYAEGQILALINRDLATFWPAQLATRGVTMPALTITPVADPIANNCGDPPGLAEAGALFCPATNQILFDEAFGREIYDDFGDFAVGYVIGRAWADAVQAALGSALQGEPKALASDCLTGAWIADALPAAGPTPPEEMFVSPGDLDEAVQTALLIGDPGISDDVKGSAFEKIAYIRLGVLNGLPACLALITG